jgi:hypothetical protein
LSLGSNFIASKRAPRIELARIFLEIVSSGSFIKAADRLNVGHDRQRRHSHA